MVDKMNPTSQFHPYTPTDVTPKSEQASGGFLNDLLSRAGIDSSSLGSMGDKLRNTDMKQSVSKVRDYANRKPGLVLGGLAAAVIGAGLLRKRSHMA